MGKERDIIQSFIKLGCRCSNNGYHLYDIQKWLREVKQTFIEIELYADCELNIVIPYIYQISLYLNGNYNIDREFYETYEEALEAGLWKYYYLANN